MLSYWDRSKVIWNKAHLYLQRRLNGNEKQQYNLVASELNFATRGAY